QSGQTKISAQSAPAKRLGRSPSIQPVFPSCRFSLNIYFIRAPQRRQSISLMSSPPFKFYHIHPSASTANLARTPICTIPSKNRLKPGEVCCMIRDSCEKEKPGNWEAVFMLRIGFDNDKYLRLQSEKIRERIARFGGKLYLEFGGKLFDDYHASRVL